METKFSDADRSRVVNALEKELQCDLSKIGKRKILFSDNAGHRYCVLGGRDHWHGVPKELIDIRDNSFKETSLVIAKMLKTKMVIFMASIGPLIEKKDELSSTNTHYHFNIERIEPDHLRIKEIPSYRLQKLTEFPYDDEMKEKQKDGFQAVKEITKEIAKGSPEKQKEIIKLLLNQL